LNPAVQVILAPFGLLFGTDSIEIVSPALKSWVWVVSEQVVADVPEMVQVTDVSAPFLRTVKA
jgi:hypothetical protein